MTALENNDLLNIVPYVFSEILDKYNVYDTLNVRINNLEEFLNYHREIKRYDWKKICFNTYTPNNVFIKTIFKKRVDKGQKLSVKNRINSLKGHILLPIWENIQNNLYKNVIQFYSKANFDLKR